MQDNKRLAATTESVGSAIRRCEIGSSESHLATFTEEVMSEQIPAVPYYVVPHPDHWTIQTREGGAGAPVAMQYCGSSLGAANFIAIACNSLAAALAAAGAA